MTTKTNADVRRMTHRVVHLALILGKELVRLLVKVSRADRDFQAVRSTLIHKKVLHLQSAAMYGRITSRPRRCCGVRLTNPLVRH
jgi:hypothetical protein